MKNEKKAVKIPKAPHIPGTFDVMVDVGGGRKRKGWCICVGLCAEVRWYTENENLRKGSVYVPLAKVERVKPKKAARRIA